MLTIALLTFTLITLFPLKSQPNAHHCLPYFYLNHLILPSFFLYPTSPFFRTRKTNTPYSYHPSQ